MNNVMAWLGIPSEGLTTGEFHFLALYIYAFTPAYLNTNVFQTTHIKNNKKVPAGTFCESTSSALMSYRINPYIELQTTWLIIITFAILSVGWKGKSTFDTQLISVISVGTGGTAVVYGLSVVPVLNPTLQGLLEPTSYNLAARLNSQLHPSSAASEKRVRGSGLPLAMGHFFYGHGN